MGAIVGHCRPLSFALERLGPAGRSGLCSQSTHLGDTIDFFVCYQALGTPRMAGLCTQSAHLRIDAHFVWRSKCWGP